MKKILLILITLTAQFAFAAPSGDPNYIPWGDLIIPQTVNAVTFFTVLYFLLRNHVRAYFSGKVETFEKAKKEAEAAKSEAEATHKDVQLRLEELKTNADQSLKTAHADAEALKLKIIEEAKSHAERLEKEARNSATHELQKAMFTLRTELLNKSVEVARDELKSNTDASVEASLQKEFVAKAREVRI